MSWYMFGLTRELTDPYSLGYRAGLEDAKKSVEESFPLLLKQALYKMDEAMEEHNWKTQVELERYPDLAICFKINVRKHR